MAAPFQWPRTTANPDCSHAIIWLNISETVRDTHIWNTNRDLHLSYSSVSFATTSSNHEWISKKFNDTKHRAVSLQQLTSCSDCQHSTCGFKCMPQTVAWKERTATIYFFLTLKFQFSLTWLQSGSPFAVVYRISSKSDNSSLRYSDLTIFKMSAVRHLTFKKFTVFVM